MGKMCVAYSKRLILVFCVLLSVASVYASNSSPRYAYAEAKIHPSSPALGKVYADGNVSDGSTETKDGVATGISQNSATGETNVSITLSADAINETHKSYFEGWTDDPTSSTIKDTNTQKTCSIGTSETSRPGKNAGTWYAVFQPIIKTPEQVKFIVYDDGMDIVTVSLQNIYKRQSLKLELVGSDASKFLLSKDNTTWTSNLSFGSEAGLAADKTVEKVDVYVTYSDGEYDSQKALQIGDDTYLKITDHENLVWQIPIVVTEPENYTFLAGEGGKYTVVFANPDQTTIKDITTDQDPTYLRSDMYTIASLTATANTGYKFFGWQTVENGIGTVFSYNATETKVTFTGSTTIRPIFLPNDRATFIIKEDVLKTPYYDLQEALDIAKNTSEYSTVVFNAPTKGTTGTLYPRYDSDGTTIIPYEVPSGVTLLIPGENTYRCRTQLEKEFGRDDFIDGSTFANYSKLILVEGTQIHLNGGHLSIYATISQNQNYNGTPLLYGWIEMGENCQIYTESGKESHIYAMGYITGKSSSSVIVNDASVVYESFQFPDFRGGMAMVSILGMGADMMNNQKGVFPVQQYYVQNVEAPMTIKWGATLKGIGVIHIAFSKSIINIDEQCLAEADLLAESAGMVYMTTNIDVHRVYDTERDVIQYLIQGKGSESSLAQVGNIYLDLGSVYGVDLKMNTTGFVMPITNNMELTFDNLTITSPNKVGLLAGSKIWIKENAILDLQAPLYVYDKEENKVTFNGTTTGYYSAGNLELIPIKHTPNNSHIASGTTAKRTKDNITSAELKIDGKLIISEDGLYTTATGADVISNTDGAIIQFNAVHTKNPTLNQARQSGSGTDTKVDYPEISINSAWLRNSDKTYVTTDNLAVGSTYQYFIVGDKGIWSLPPVAIAADSWNGTSATITIPETYQMTVTCTVENLSSDDLATAFTATLSNSNFAFAGENGDFSKSISLKESTMSILINYTPQNNTVEPQTATLTIKNAKVPTAEYTFETELSVTEEYIPDFSLSKTGVTLPTIDLGETSILEDAFIITPAENTVATLDNDARLTWTYTIKNEDGTPNDEFTYTQGTLSNGKIEGNTVTYTSTQAGTKHVILSIIATYTPQKGKIQTITKEIYLIGTSEIENNLAFNMPEYILVTDKNIPIAFNEDHNNTSAITVELTANGTAELPAVELINNGDGTYSINALNAGSFSLKATQAAADNIGSAIVLSKEIKVKKLTPEPIWEWGVLYGNQVYSSPFDLTTVVADNWTLKESEDLANVLAYDNVGHTAQVMNVGSNSTVTFAFTQEETPIYEAYTGTYIANVYPDPRILPLTISDNAKYEIIVNTQHSEGVTCDNSGLIFLPAEGYIIVQFIGVAGDLIFSVITSDVPLTDITVEENANISNAESWKTITKSNTENKWAFSQMNATCVRITNNTGTPLLLSNLTITENTTYTRNTYYSKATATAYPMGAGKVSARGSYSDSNVDSETNYESVFTTWPDFEESTFAHAMLNELMSSINSNLRFSMRAQSMPGYYFTEWSAVGQPMKIDGVTLGDGRNDYELSFIMPSENVFKGYDFFVYEDIYCQQYPDICSYAKPESGESYPEAVQAMNQGTLELIPATHVGTWQANFALAEVVSVEDVSWESKSPSASDVAKKDLIFNIKGDNVDDFEASISGNGFSFAENDITLSTTYNTYTINVSYAPQDIHGRHTAKLTLSRVAIEEVAETSSKTATLTVTENLTPYFTLANGDFGSGTLGQETIIDILPANTNKVAQVMDPSKIKWEATLNDGAPFEVESIEEDGTCHVRYFRTEAGEKSATLTITATYTDSKGTEIPFATTCTLTGSSTAEKAANTLALVQDIVLYVDDEPISPFSSIDANNTAPITITLPEDCGALMVEDDKIKPSGNFATGTFTITASQDGNDYFQASGDLTTTVTVKKHTPEVKWNWTQLYFGQTYYTPITTNSDGAVTIAAVDDYNILHYSNATKTVVIDPLTEGEYDVTFSVNIAESNLYESYQQTHTSVVYKDPRHLRVDVNTAVVYQAVTIADFTGENVSFSNGGIRFADVAGSEYTSRQWTLYFIGVPDQLVFTPTGNNAWQIQESTNGSNWSTTFASAKIPAGEQFTMSLRPSTQYLRIAYATNADVPSNGVLNSFYITALEGVKANVDGLYMPIAADVVNNPTTKQVELQYTSQEKLTISTSDPQFTVDVEELQAPNVDEYAEQIVTITSKATQEKEGRIYVKNAAGDILLELPIYTFIFPQTLPIQLATDEPQRFYYVTTASYYAKWDMNTRVVTLQNAPANTTRSLTFAFDGVPTLIRFNHTAGDKGTWVIRESANDADWYEASAELRQDQGTEIEQGLQASTRYVKVEYTSPYSEAVEMSNLIIVGDASVTTDVNVLEFTEEAPTQTLTVSAINLAAFVVRVDNDNFTVAEIDKSALTGTGIVEVPVEITWSATKAVEYATLSIVNPADEETILATVELVGKKSVIISPTNVGIYTGLSKDMSEIKGSFEGAAYRPVDLTNAFDAATSTKALFDYLFIYGETSTMDGTSVVTTPTNQRGSNAKTPCYIYQREGDTYKLYKVVDNVNDSEKAIATYIPVPVSNIPLRVYITGFAPYASTGYTKEDEGVWQFRGQAGSKLDVYLEDCYIYSRYKTVDGHSFLDRDNGESFGEMYARGSGGVLVFECSSVNNANNPFAVTIHTMDRNMLKSHYGCFLSSIVGRAFQVSSPVQIHLISTDLTPTTHLSFDDIWPTGITRTEEDGVVTAETLTTKRTNGFLSLQKQVNNAPSIDLGNPNTVVNFNGGQVELQNAQNVSDNYKTTLAISYRGGLFGPASSQIKLAHGVGSDEVTGTVNFNDGTTTVIPMTVDERYRQYYLMDEDEHGNELATTSTLRCPEHTYVYGGSHCMMRACNEPTSKGGAPLSHDGDDAVRLGLYKYPSAPYTTGEGDNPVTHAGGWTLIEGANGLVSIPVDYIPNIKVGDEVARQYGVASVMPNDNGTPDDPTDDYLNFWVPAGYDDSVTPEVDLKISYWKAAMTRIKAEYASYNGSVGGDVKIGDDSDVETELVYNFLYCALDNDIKDVISKKEVINGQEVHSYAAPVKHPAAQGYLKIRPSYVSDSAVHYVKNLKPYKVQNRVYYITPIPSADNWMTFTAPFDVENIYVVETYDEKELATQGNKAEIKIKQAEHNADFAAFFGVALALGSDRDFDDIYANYIGWAKLQDVGKYTGQYNLRGKHELKYYDGTNWSKANYYLYENQGTWTINADGVFTTQWTLPNVSDKILMNKGETYSLLFPYCTGCWEYDEDGNFIERTMWDYWSGKFVIFESTLRSEENPHVIDGVNTAQAYVETHTPAPSEAYVLGNTSFGDLRITNEHLYQYVSKDPLYEEFKPVGNVSTAIQPTSSFLLANITAPAGQKITGIRRTGEIIYDKHGTSDVGHIPTVGGGHDLFITSIEGGINVAVAAPQYVRVLSSTGSVIYSGMIQTALDIQLPSLGMYVVSGEKEVQKVMYQTASLREARLYGKIAEKSDFLRFFLLCKQCLSCVNGVFLA